EQERQRGNALAEIRSGDLARLDGLSRAVEAVVDDLERDSECQAELAQLRAAAREQARSLEELRRLERAAGQVLLDGRVRPVPVAALRPLAAGARPRLGRSG